MNGKSLLPGNHCCSAQVEQSAERCVATLLELIQTKVRALLPIGPMLVYEQLPDSNPLKKTAADYIGRYEAKYGKDSRSTFGGHAWDAYILLARAIPEALKKGKPGTREFRAALRDALEGTKELVASHGVFNMSAQDHNGFDNRARTMIRIDNGKWVLVK